MKHHARVGMAVTECSLRTVLSVWCLIAYKLCYPLPFPSHCTSRTAIWLLDCAWQRSEAKPAIGHDMAGAYFV